METGACVWLSPPTPWHSPQPTETCGLEVDLEQHFRVARPSPFSSGRDGGAILVKGQHGATEAEYSTFSQKKQQQMKTQQSSCGTLKHCTKTSVGYSRLCHIQSQLLVYEKPVHIYNFCHFYRLLTITKVIKIIIPEVLVCDCHIMPIILHYKPLKNN